MAAILIAILSLTALGIPIALALDRAARGPLLIGTAFLYGSGTVFLILLFLPMTLVVVTVAGLLGCLVAWFLGRRATQQPSNPATLHVVDLATLASIATYAIYATLAPLWEWDFWAIWGLKARLFFEHGGIDWRFLASRWNTFVHPDYPLLVPLNYDFIALIAGGWSDRWLGILNVAFGVALLLIARGLAARETSAFIASLLTFLLSWMAMSRFVGLAEGALIAFGGAGVLFIRDALRRGDNASWRHGAVLLGLAANCKNEGLALLVAVTIVLVIFHRKVAIRLQPAYWLTVPWLILRAVHALRGDMASGGAMSRLAARLRFTPQIVAYLGERLYHPWFWIAIAVGVIVIRPARERFVLLVTAIQLAFYAGSYFITPYDVRWHVGTSWPRLTEQIAVPTTFVVFLALAEIVRRGEDAGDAEARSAQQ
jgi:hypothetical protein